MSETKNCNFYLINGTCRALESCPFSHPTLKTISKKKLQFKNQNFKPNPETKIIQQTKQFFCSCCQDQPKNCQNNKICIQLGNCYCVSQKDLEQMIKGIQETENFCNCCFGDFYNCQNSLCVQLGMCQCQIHQDMEKGFENEDDENYFSFENSNCKCCKGYVFNCYGKNCKKNCYCYQNNQLSYK